MKRAIERLATAPEVVWIDGNQCPPLDYPSRAIVDGDRLVAAIAAASILAKTTRDAMLVELDRSYPAVRVRPAQGLFDARASRRAGAARSLRGAPALVRAGPPDRVRFLMARQDVAQAASRASVRRFRHRRRLARQRHAGARAHRPRARRPRRLGRVRRCLARRLSSGDGPGAPRRNAVAAARQPASADAARAGRALRPRARRQTSSPR